MIETGLRGGMPIGCCSLVAELRNRSRGLVRRAVAALVAEMRPRAGFLASVACTQEARVSSADFSTCCVQLPLKLLHTITPLVFPLAALMPWDESMRPQA